MSDAKRQIVYTNKAAKPPASYSQAVKAAGLVFVSGTAPADPATGAIVGETIQLQTRQCLTNIQAILEAAGSSLAKLVSATVVLAEGRRFRGHERRMVEMVSERTTGASGRETSGENPRPEGLHRCDRRGLTK